MQRCLTCRVEDEVEQRIRGSCRHEFRPTSLKLIFFRSQEAVVPDKQAFQLPLKDFDVQPQMPVALPIVMLTIITMAFYHLLGLTTLVSSQTGFFTSSPKLQIVHPGPHTMSMPSSVHNCKNLSSDYDGPRTSKPQIKVGDLF